MTDKSTLSSACVSNNVQRDIHNVDSLDPNRGMRYDRMGTAVVGIPNCSIDKNQTTSPLCRMKTPGHTLVLAATYDRLGARCQHKPEADAIANTL